MPRKGVVSTTIDFQRTGVGIIILLLCKRINFASYQLQSAEDGLISSRDTSVGSGSKSSHSLNGSFAVAITRPLLTIFYLLPGT